DGRTPLGPTANGKGGPGRLAKREIDIDGRIPRDLAAIVRRATEFEREKRYQDGEEMAGGCESALRARAPGKDPRTIVAVWAKKHVQRAAAIASAASAEEAHRSEAD